jgi:hypothetical protein
MPASISKGGVTDSASTSTAVTATSTSPVGRFGLTVPSGRLRTVPVTSTTHSGRTRSAVANAAPEASGSKTH